MLVIAGTVKVEPELRAEAVQSGNEDGPRLAGRGGLQVVPASTPTLKTRTHYLIFEQWESEAALLPIFRRRTWRSSTP